MKKYLCFIFLLLNLPFCSSFPQTSQTPDDTTDSMIMDGVEMLLQDSDTDSEDSDLMDYLNDLRRNPIDLNMSNAEQLATVPLITPALAERIISYRIRNSRFVSKRELLKIDGFSETLYSQVSPYFIARKADKKNAKNVETVKNRFSAELRTLFFQDLVPKRGFITGNYQGSRYRNASRLRINFDAGKFNLSSGIAVDKDPGEISAADLISANLNIQSKSFVRSLTLGDYQLNFGYGLTLSNSYSSPKSYESSAGKRRSRRILPYTSTGEYSFFRGAVANFSFTGLEAFVFFSKRFLDATVDSLSNQIRSLYADGYHRTQSELSRRSAFSETLYGARLEYGSERFMIGGTYRSSRYSLPFSRDTVKKLYGMNGTASSAAGIDISWKLGPSNLFGEASISQSRSVAVYGGVAFTAGPKAEVTFSFRRFPFDFSPAHNSVLSKRSASENETGFLSSIRITPVKRLSITAFFDQYSFPYRTFYVATSSRGRDFVTNCDYKIREGMILSLRFKTETKEESGKSINEIGKTVSMIISRQQKNLRVGFSYGKRSFRLRSRYEYCFVSYGGLSNSGRGQLLFTDITSETLKGVGLSARIIFFHTDSYDSRIYEFENDIAGLMTNLALYGKGMRWYLIANLNPFPNISIKAKYSETFYSGMKKIGSGNDEVSGNVLNRLSVSIEAKF